MDWNKNNLRYRRPGRRRKKGFGFFARLGAKMDAFLRRITFRKPAKGAAKISPKIKVKTPATIEEIFDDLKVSLPKSRGNPPVSAVPAPASAAEDLELADNLENDYLANRKELDTEIFDEIVFLEDDDFADKADSYDEASAAAGEGEDSIESAASPFQEAASASKPHKPPLRQRAAEFWVKNQGRLKYAAGVAALIAVIGGAWWAARFFTGTVPTAQVAKIPLTSLPKVDTPPPGLFERYAARTLEATVSEYTVAEGATLSQALEAVGLMARAEGQAIIDCLTAERGLDVVRPGAVVRAVWSDPEKTELTRLEYHPASGDPPFVVRPKADGAFWHYSLASPAITVTTAASGAVESTLWEAGSAAGLDAGIIMNMADIMASEIDFLSGVKAGDSFQVLYSRAYSDGRPIGGVNVEMLRMTNDGADYELYRYVNGRGDVGYYDQLGRSSKKTFFNSPLQYTRISSGFSKSRLHPIYKVRRAHEAVDYAAPTGTPVSSVADGTVIFAGWSGGYGRLITIKHDEVYTTMYAHLSRFARGLKKGDHVKQGDLIGYVGATGTATGPHLDFRMKMNNTFIDPQAVLAKQEGRMLEAAEAQAFSQLVTAARNRMRENLEARSGV